MTAPVPTLPARARVQMDRARAIAARDQMVVLDDQPASPDARRAWSVIRATSGSVHHVQLVRDRLVCDATCLASAYGRYCAHRAAVRAALAAAADAVDAAGDAATAPVIP